MRRLRLGMAQVNTTVGDFAGNTQKILKAIADARAFSIDLITFPELAICGYPPEDLLFKPKFIEENLRCLNQIITQSAGITAIVGFVDAKDDIYDAAAIIYDKKLIGVYHKIYLPNYGVFDENRYFQKGNECPIYTICGVHVGVSVCEDIWYEAGPVTVQAYGGAEVVINISASPFHAGKGNFRERMLSTRAADNVVIVAYTNLVGGQDELVFDGNSMILNEMGCVIARGKQFEEDLIVADLDVEAVFRTRLHDSRWRKETLPGDRKWLVTRTAICETEASVPKPLLPLEQKKTRGFPEDVYNALVLGTRDYIIKNGFQKVAIGLSGGIDSSLVATIAVDALSPSNVIGVAMPSRYSSVASLSDAELLAKNLDIKLLNISFDKIFQAYLDILSEPFKGVNPDTTEENIQARIRGNILMALSNKFGWLVLTTGNKSEIATGYTTLYGDMAGGFAVIKDVPKTLVYELVRYRNSLSDQPLIPATIMTKEPSAELRPEQRDTDSLPPYSLLDPILAAYVEEDKSLEQIIDMGYAADVVKSAIKLVDGSEYKRRQAPPGIKITPRAFGRDRRLPLTNRYKG